MTSDLSKTHGQRGVSIRAKILLAFFAICAVSGAAAFYAVYSMQQAGGLVVETYDKPLMSISFARAVHADFAEMQAVFVRRLAAPHGKDADLKKNFEERSSTLDDDLGVVLQRASTDRTRKATAKTRAAVAAWHVVAKAMLARGATNAEWQAFDDASATVAEQIDLLVNYAAGDGFVRRQKTTAAINSNQQVQIAAFFAALLLSTIVIIALIRRIMGPVRAASQAADRIAHGELDVAIPISGRDELASLLGSMSTMRDSIRTMVERERTQRRSAQARFVDAIENSLEGVIVVGADGKIVVANAQAQLFFGKASSHLRHDGQYGALIEHAIEIGVFAAETAGELRALATGEVQAVDIEEKLSDGRWLRLVQSRTSEGGAILVLSDISLLKEREFVLREAKERAEAANRAKTEFLTNMGHELRTPLNAVIGFSEIIASEMMGPSGHPKYTEFATDILHSGRHLLAIINDILDLSKSESGRIELQMGLVCVAALFEETRRLVTKDFDKARVTLEVEAPAADVMIEGDSVKLQQILLNLLSNAAKFTAPGGHTTMAARHDGDRVLISVKDTGIGMRAEDIPLALSPFGQVDSRLARKYEGTGLGLALTKALVELHGGTLAIESAPGVGTTVSISLAAIDEPVVLAQAG